MQASRATLLLNAIAICAAGEVLTNSSSSTGKPTAGTITASVGVIALLEVDELTAQIILSCYLKAVWRDGGDSDELDLFRPRLQPFGSTRVERLGFVEPVVSVDRNGSEYTQVTMVRIHQPCRFSYQRFPLDTQECSLFIGGTDGRSLSPPRNRSALTLEHHYDRYEPCFTFTIWMSSVPGEQWYNDTGGGSAAGHQQRVLPVRVRLRRAAAVHLARLYAPSALVVTTSWMCSLLPAPLIRSRLTVCVLNVLTVLLVCRTAERRGPAGAGGSGPVSAVHVWETGCLVLVTAAVLEAVLDMRLLVQRAGDGQRRTRASAVARVYFWTYGLFWCVFCLVYYIVFVPPWTASLQHD